VSVCKFRLLVLRTKYYRDDYIVLYCIILLYYTFTVDASLQFNLDDTQYLQKIDLINLPVAEH